MLPVLSNIPVLPSDTAHQAPVRDFAAVIIALTAYLLFISICTLVIAIYLVQSGRFKAGTAALKQAAEVFMPRKPRKTFESVKATADVVLRFVRAEWRGKRIRVAEVIGSSGGKASLLESELFTDFHLKSKSEVVSVRIQTEDNAMITDSRTVTVLMMVQEKKQMLGSTVFMWKLPGDIQLHFQVITFDELVI